jgi:aryl carrier-like protein
MTRQQDQVGIPGWTATELTIRQLWQDTLGVAVDQRDVSFFSVGGDSIRNVAFVAEARRAGMPITIRDVLVHRTIARLGRVVDERAETPANSATDNTVERLLDAVSRTDDR